MRTMAVAASVALLCMMTSSVFAADMTVPAAPQEQKSAEMVCLRWIPQTYSWYNYCDPIPYYTRREYTQFSWLNGR